jgi:uncharacterized protein
VTGIGRQRVPAWQPTRWRLRLGERVLQTSLPIDCLRCGVCCHSQLATYVRVTGADWERLATEAERVAHFIGHRAFMRMRDGHCAALDVRTTTDGAREFFCTVYERRPQVCRDLARGSPECEGELLAKRDRTEAVTR